MLINNQTIISSIIINALSLIVLLYIWQAFCDTLQREEISENDDFFMMGGNSISAAHAAHKLGIDMRLLYAFPTPFKLLNGVLDQKNSHGILSNYSPVSAKRAKILDVMQPKSNTSRVNLEDSKLLGQSSDAANGKGTLGLCRQLNVDRTISYLEKNDDSLFSLGPLTGNSSLPPASHGPVSVYGRDDVWISNFCLPFAYSLSRCNQLVTWGERKLNNARRLCSLIKLPRYTKGCLQELWKVPLRSCVDASPLIVYKDGTINVFIGSHSRVFLCIDAVR